MRCFESEAHVGSGPEHGVLPLIEKLFRFLFGLHWHCELRQDQQVLVIEFFRVCNVVLLLRECQVFRQLSVHARHDLSWQVYHSLRKKQSYVFVIDYSFELLQFALVLQVALRL